MLNLCHSGHKPICYGDTYCPICELKIEKDELEVELKDAKEEIATLKEEIDEFNSRHKEPNEDDPRKER